MEFNYEKLIESNNEVINAVNKSIETSIKLEDGRIKADKATTKLMWNVFVGLMALMLALMISIVLIVNCQTRAFNRFVDGVYGYQYPLINTDVNQTQEVTIEKE